MLANQWCSTVHEDSSSSDDDGGSSTGDEKYSSSSDEDSYSTIDVKESISGAEVEELQGRPHPRGRARPPQLNILGGSCRFGCLGWERVHRTPTIMGFRHRQTKKFP
ncbi:hypothetical protein MKW92_024628 [Papaver armeniacum]|nr:hypothetical protein MKW92_024628 [Papaver armeniacum]